MNKIILVRTALKKFDLSARLPLNILDLSLSFVLPIKTKSYRRRQKSVRAAQALVYLTDQFCPWTFLVYISYVNKPYHGSAARSRFLKIGKELGNAFFFC